LQKLHRGEYSLKGEPGGPVAVRGMKIVGFTKDLPLKDKLAYFITGGWFFGWFVFFIVATICQNIFGISDDGWVKMWHCYIWITLGMALGITVWFFIGGIKDVRDLFANLRTAKRNYQDDGTVIDHRSLGEELAEESETSE